MMRVVLDTNIFISAVLGGRLGAIIDDWKAGKFTLIITDSAAREYLEVINRPRLKIPQDEIIAVSDYLLQHAEFVTPQEAIHIITADRRIINFLKQRSREKRMSSSVETAICWNLNLSRVFPSFLRKNS